MAALQASDKSSHTHMYAAHSRSACALPLEPDLRLLNHFSYIFRVLSKDTTPGRVIQALPFF